MFIQKLIKVKITGIYMILPDEFIIFDTEYTAWEGSNERNWSEGWEEKELVKIAAMKVKKLAMYMR